MFPCSAIRAQILAVACKEWRLLSRNLHGLSALFLMPAIFVLVMSFTLKNTLTAKVDLPVAGWVQEDTTPFATQWAREWQARHPGPRFASRQALQQALATRQVEAGVVVRAPLLDPASGRPDSRQLEMWLGNRVAPAAAARLRAELSFSLLQAQMKRAAAEAGPFAGVLLDSASGGDLLAADSGVAVRYLYEIESGRRMTAVQQSVPAWLIFGMFFVVIPIAGVLIQERNEGTLARLATQQVSSFAILGGKLLAFIVLNWVQLGFMLLVGRWLVPWLGGDALSLAIAPGWFLLMVLATSTAAVGLALLIASGTRNFEHAAALGGGLNVVLGAIAGVMVPRVLMPPAMQTFSAWSPMGWALDGMQSVFLGTPSAGEILPRAGLLFAFALACLLGSGWLLRRPAN
ncbi:ABC transporter permease [Ramlibacter sp.]|uniref:ABC transporter permease n=1 Tax=Ramlibacter sp. TaxID=1917967 RepID=UPI00261DFD3A|nr:ABC transporter permease [Ramlibacter sp.]MDB5957024.1 transporter permease [Ramlibacter sp.]